MTPGDNYFCLRITPYSNRSIDVPNTSLPGLEIEGVEPPSLYPQLEELVSGAVTMRRPEASRLILFKLAASR